MWYVFEIMNLKLGIICWYISVREDYFSVGKNAQTLLLQFSLYIYLICNHLLLSNAKNREKYLCIEKEICLFALEMCLRVKENFIKKHQIYVSY